MKKIVLFIVVLVAIATPLGFYINHKIKISRFNEKLQQALGKDQGLIETILKVESESTSMSYKELFDICDKSISERTEIIVDLRGLYPDMESKLKDSLIEFLNSENELVRSKSHAYRKQFSISSAYDNVKEYVSDYSYNDYTYEYYLSNVVKYKNEIKEAIIDMLSNLVTFQTNYDLLIVKERNLSKIMSDEGLRFIPLFEKYKDSNHNHVQSCIDYASMVAKKCEIKF